MASSELIILDVGHGNCAVIKHGTEAIIIDAPGKPIVARTLDELGIKSIHALLISHADSDHLSGAIPLLLNSERPVTHVYVNPDNRDSNAWHNFRVAVGQARANWGTSTHTSLNVEDPQGLALHGTTLKILHPTPEICLATTGGTHTDGHRINANNMSAVVLVEHNGERICLLAADSDQHSLEIMTEGATDLSAPILVFPHHGGHAGAGTDNRAFARDLVASVQPLLVLFSLGRGSHGTPRADIINGVREGLAGVEPYIACTQLSRNCLPGSGPASTNRNLNKHSDGYNKDSCCAGTISVPLEANGLSSLLAGLTADHESFIKKDIPNSLCRRQVGNGQAIPQVIVRA